MFISSNIGNVRCLTFAEYEAHIKKCISNIPGNEIWCYCNEEQNFPCLAILVKDMQAVVNYFSEDNNQMFASKGDMFKDGTIDFENGQYEVAAYQVIPETVALECALQFFYSQEKPSYIQWEEL